MLTQRHILAALAFTLVVPAPILTGLGREAWAQERGTGTPDRGIRSPRPGDGRDTRDIRPPSISRQPGTQPSQPSQPTLPEPGRDTQDPLPGETIDRLDQQRLYNQRQQQLDQQLERRSLGRERDAEMQRRRAEEDARQNYYERQSRERSKMRERREDRRRLNELDPSRRP